MVRARGSKLIIQHVRLVDGIEEILHVVKADERGIMRLGLRASGKEEYKKE